MVVAYCTFSDAPLCTRVKTPAKLVSMTMDFRAFVAKAPHLTMQRQRTLVYGGKLIFSNAAAKIPKVISHKWQDGFSFLNDGNLDKCLSKNKLLLRLTTPALCLSSPHNVIEPNVWQTRPLYPLRTPSIRHAKTTALIRTWYDGTLAWVYSQTWEWAIFT